MKTHLLKKIFFLSFLILTGIGYISYINYKSNEKLSESTHWVQHTEEVIYQSGQILSQSKEIQIEVQGYLIAGDTLLPTLRVLPGTIFVEIEQLRQLTLDNPAQQKREDSLTFYMHEYLHFSLQIVELRRNRGLEAASSYLSTGQGNHYTEHIDQIILAIQQDEKNLFKERINLNNIPAIEFARSSALMSILMTLVTLLFLIVGIKYFLQNREKGRRAAELIVANKELLFQNTEKENRAQELVIANKELEFQNAEKENRARELIIANGELAFQSAEKEKAQLERMHNESRLTRAQQVAHMGSWELNLTTNIITCSAEACSIYGIPPGQNRIPFNFWMSFVHPEDIDFVLKQIRDSRYTLADLSFYYRILHKTGVVRHIYIEGKLEYDANVQPTGMYGVAQDVTEIKTAQQQIQFDRNNLAALINNTNDLMWSIDKKFRLITFNNAFNSIIFQATGNNLATGDDIFFSQYTADQLSRYKMFYQRALSGETFTITDYFDNHHDILSEISFYPLRNGDTIIGTACFSRDITERSKNERHVLEMELEIFNRKVQEQKVITRAIAAAEERERNHLGQELHDNISQILVSTRLFLAAAGDDSGEVQELIKYPVKLIDSAIQEIRKLSSRYVTPLKDIDLRELVESQLNKISELQSIKTVLDYNVTGCNIGDDLKLNIYRIIQEQLSNISKYASPENVNISIQKQGKALNVEIRDDGKGFNTEKKRKGIGISNMINRIESFNGKMVMRSSPGKGCRINISIPV